MPVPRIALATFTLAAGLALGNFSPTGAVVADSSSAQDPVAYRWRNLAWTVDKAVTRGGAERISDSPGDVGLLVGKRRASATFTLNVPKACRILRVRVKTNGITVDGGARVRVSLKRVGSKPRTYEPLTFDLDTSGTILRPDLIGRPAKGSRRFVYKVKDRTPRGGEVGYVMEMTFGGSCPRTPSF